MSTNDSTPDPTAGEAGLHAKCSDTFGWCSTCRPAGRLAAIRRALDDEIANLADDGARLSHSVVRRMEAVLAGYADDANTPASEGLNEDERRALRDSLVAAWRDDYSVQSVVDGLAAAVAQIKADAEAKARADLDSTIAAIERLAAGWEASSRLGHHNAGGFAGALRALLRDRAARIARGDA